MKTLTMNSYRFRYNLFVFTLLLGFLIGVEDCFGFTLGDSMVVISLVDKTFVIKRDLEEVQENKEKESDKGFNFIPLIAFLTFLLQLIKFMDKKKCDFKNRKRAEMNFFKNLLRRLKC